MKTYKITDAALLVILMGGLIFSLVFNHPAATALFGFSLWVWHIFSAANGMAHTQPYTEMRSFYKTMLIWYTLVLPVALTASALLIFIFIGILLFPLVLILALLIDLAYLGVTIAAIFRQTTGCISHN